MKFTSEEILESENVIIEEELHRESSFEINVDSQLKSSIKVKDYLDIELSNMKWVGSFLKSSTVGS